MAWAVKPTDKRGRQPVYSDAAVQICLTMKVLFGMALRQTTGFVERRLRWSGLNWVAPDFSTLSRRQKTLAVNIPHRGSRDLQPTVAFRRSVVSQLPHVPRRRRMPTERPPYRCSCGCCGCHCSTASVRISALHFHGVALGPKQTLAFSMLSATGDRTSEVEARFTLCAKSLRSFRNPALRHAEAASRRRGRRGYGRPRRRPERAPSRHGQGHRRPVSPPP